MDEAVGIDGPASGYGQASARTGLPTGGFPVRVGADCGTGAGERAGRRGALDRNTQGEVVATSVMASPCATMYAGLDRRQVAFQPDRPSMCAGLFCCPKALSQRHPYLSGPETVSSSRLDSFLPSSVQMDPVSPQSPVAGRVMVTSALESGWTVIRQCMLLGFAIR